MFGRRKATKGPKLSVDMIPSTTFNKNVRSMLPREAWDEYRTAAYRRAKYRCEICEGVGPEHPVECHEEWEFNWKTKTQRLKKLIALCPDCHMVKHMGFAISQDKGTRAIEHLADVNDWTMMQAMRHIMDARDEWERRSKVRWEVDISVLKFY